MPILLPMPIFQLLKEMPQLALSSEETGTVSAAFDAALTALGIARDDPKAGEIARVILLAVKHGERDPHTLRDVAVETFK